MPFPLPSRRRPWCVPTVVLLLAGLGAAVPAGAELAVLTNGKVMKVASYELDGERMRFALRGGGFVTLDVRRVERILEDEIVPEPEVGVATAPATPAFALGWSEGQTMPAGPHAEVLVAAGRRHSLNPLLLAAVARAESAYDARALSHKGARGLMQVMPATAERFGVSPHELWDPVRNVEAGARYLRFLVDRFEGDLTRVLAAYNAGEGAVDRYEGVPPYRETRGYVAKVLTFLGIEPSPIS